jgi:hypothetical protein
MQQAIYKYELLLLDSQQLSLPLGTKILHVNTQNDGIYLWALVNVKETRVVNRTFKVVATGQNNDFSSLTYIGTVHMTPFVWHIFEA